MKVLLHALSQNGLGDGLVVSLVAFYSDDPSSNSAEVYCYLKNCCFKRTQL